MIVGTSKSSNQAFYLHRIKTPSFLDEHRLNLAVHPNVITILRKRVNKYTESQTDLANVYRVKICMAVAV